MNKSTVSWLVAAGSVIIAFVIILLMKAANPKGWREKYDERQMAARGRGYMYAFYAAVITAFIPCFFSEELSHFLGTLVYFIPLLSGFMVHITYCIWNDAYVDLSAEPKKWMFSLSAIGIGNILIAFGNLADGFVENGQLKTAVINLIVGIIGLLAVIQQFIKSRLDKREVDEDEES